MSAQQLTATFLDAATVACELIKPDCVDQWHIHQTTTPKQVANRIANCELVFTNKVQLGAQELAAAPKLKLIVVAATGYDIIDLTACQARNIAVANSPGYSASSVPEHCLALMFAVTRSIVPLHNKVHDGSWSKSPIFCLHDHPIIELHGKTVGIIGSGSLGRATGKLCTALGMHVIYRARHDGTQDELPRLAFTKLLAQADIISLHCPLDSTSHNLFNRETLELMQDGAILINTARGGLVDATALVAALTSGKLGGAGIDVLDLEPPPTDHPLVTCNHPHLVVTPHTAWASQEVQLRLATLVATTADNFFAGKPKHLVT